MYEFSQPNAVEYSWSWSNMAKALANFNSWICMILVGIGFFCACLTHNFLHRIGWGHLLVHYNHNSQILWKFNIWWWNYRPKFLTCKFYVFIPIYQCILSFFYYFDIRPTILLFHIFEFNPFFYFFLSTCICKILSYSLKISLKMDISKFHFYTFQFCIWGEFNYRYVKKN